MSIKGTLFEHVTNAHIMQGHLDIDFARHLMGSSTKRGILCNAKWCKKPDTKVMFTVNAYKGHYGIQDVPFMVRDEKTGKMVEDVSRRKYKINDDARCPSVPMLLLGAEGVPKDWPEWHKIVNKREVETFAPKHHYWADNKVFQKRIRQFLCDQELNLDSVAKYLHQSDLNKIPLAKTVRNLLIQSFGGLQNLKRRFNDEYGTKSSDDEDCDNDVEGDYGDDDDEEDSGNDVEGDYGDDDE